MPTDTRFPWMNRLDRPARRTAGRPGIPGAACWLRFPERVRCLSAAAALLACAGCAGFRQQEAPAAPPRLQTITLREYNGPDVVLPIPEVGLPLANAVPRPVPSPSRSSAPAPPTGSAVQPLLEVLPTVSARIQDLAASSQPQIRLKGIAAVMAEEGGFEYRGLVEKLRQLRDSGAILLAAGTTPENAADACIQWMLINAQPPTVRPIQHESDLADAVGAGRITVNGSAPQVQNAAPASAPRLVLIRRKSGHEFVVPYELVHDTAIGALLLQDRDSVRIHFVDSILDTTARPDGTAQVLFSGTSGDRDGVLEVGEFRLLDALEKRQLLEGEFNNLAVLTRETPGGGIREYLLPLTSDAQLGDRLENLRELYTKIPVLDGDWIHYDRIETSPLILMSRTASLRLQREALQEQFSLQVAAKERARLHAAKSGTRHQLVPGTSASPLSRQLRGLTGIWTERIGSGLAGLGAAVGVR